MNLQLTISVLSEATIYQLELPGKQIVWHMTPESTILNAFNELNNLNYYNIIIFASSKLYPRNQLHFLNSSTFPLMGLMLFQPLSRFYMSTSPLPVWLWRFQQMLILFFREAPKLPSNVRIVKCAWWLIEVPMKSLTLCHRCSQSESPEWLDHPGLESGGLHSDLHSPSPFRLTFLVCHLPYWKEDRGCWCLWRTTPNQMGCRTKWEVQGNSPYQETVKLINQGEMFSLTSQSNLVFSLLFSES